MSWDAIDYSMIAYVENNFFKEFDLISLTGVKPIPVFCRENSSVKWTGENNSDIEFDC